MRKKVQPLAIVTGSAHRLGRAFALTMARHGYAILLHYYSSSIQAEATKSEIEKLNVPVYIKQVDLTIPEQIISLYEFLDSLPHEIRILINSASIMLRSDIRTLSLSEWDSTFKLNLRAPFLLAQQSAKRMAEGGLIVNITDICTQRAWTGFPAYTVSKAALESMTRVMARAYAPKVRVNAIALGLVLPSKNILSEEWDKLVNRLPMKRAANLDEITSALEFLLSDRYITGHTIVVDGGYSLI